MAFRTAFPSMASLLCALLLSSSLLLDPTVAVAVPALRALSPSRGGRAALHLPPPSQATLQRDAAILKAVLPKAIRASNAIHPALIARFEAGKTEGIRLSLIHAHPAAVLGRAPALPGKRLLAQTANADTPWASAGKQPSMSALSSLRRRALPEGEDIEVYGIDTVVKAWELAKKVGILMGMELGKAAQRGVSIDQLSQKELDDLSDIAEEVILGQEGYDVETIFEGVRRRKAQLDAQAKSDPADGPADRRPPPPPSPNAFSLLDPPTSWTHAAARLGAGLQAAGARLEPSLAREELALKGAWSSLSRGAAAKAVMKHAY
ncbi:MAG: hypothetical protein M1826_007029 [Phylliscum demangeonii]|nr:MAG: hypothetical protein M1826_007029 [Phylliscum demangeonii]